MNPSTAKKPLIDALSGKKPDRYPVWFLRQAGRYLKEYRDIRAKMSFLELCQSPKMAAEVTLQPLRRFDLDAAIIFSDILVLPTAMGFSLSFDSGHGPLIEPVIRSEKDLNLIIDNKHIQKDLSYVGEAISIVASHLEDHQTMIGFAGAPFTVASYLIEGKGSKNYTEVKRMIYQEPKTFLILLEKLAEQTIAYLQMQVKAGAQTLMLFDSWAGHIEAQDYKELIYPSTKKIFDAIASWNIPIIYYPGSSSHIYKSLEGFNINAVAVDWRIGLKEADQLLADRSWQLQGCLDPQVLIAPKNVLEKKVIHILEEAKSISSKRQHIFNVGHGLLPHTPPEAINQVISIIRNFKA